MLRYNVGELAAKPELGVGEGASWGAGAVAVLDAVAEGILCCLTCFAASTARYLFIFFCCEGRAALLECSRRVAVCLGFWDGCLGSVSLLAAFCMLVPVRNWKKKLTKLVDFNHLVFWSAVCLFSLTSTHMGAQNISKSHSLTAWPGLFWLSLAPEAGPEPHY